MTAAKALLMLSSVTALQAPCTRRPRTQLAALGFAELAEQSSLPPADKSRITVLSDAESVGAEVWKRIDEAGQRAVKERGTFTLAIPGGSVLKMLGGTKPEWAEDCLLAYVNHKAVNDDDAALMRCCSSARHKPSSRPKPQEHRSHCKPWTASWSAASMTCAAPLMN